MYLYWDFKNKIMFFNNWQLLKHCEILEMNVKIGYFEKVTVTLANNTQLFFAEPHRLVASRFGRPTAKA